MHAISYDKSKCLGRAVGAQIRRSPEERPAALAAAPKRSPERPAAHQKSSSHWSTKFCSCGPGEADHAAQEAALRGAPQAMGAEALDDKISELERDIRRAEARFKKRTEKLQEKYKEFEAEKESEIKAVREGSKMAKDSASCCRAFSAVQVVSWCVQEVGFRSEGRRAPGVA